MKVSVRGLAAAALLAASACTLAAPPNVKGPDDAAVTMVVYSAFACPYCAQGAKQLADLEKKYPGQLRVVFKHYPLSLGAAGLLAHQAAIAAGEQGKFWEMHDRLFAGKKDPDRTALEAIARDLGMDVARFMAALDSARAADEVQRDLVESKAFNVRATPTYYIDGYRLEGLQDASVFEKIIEHRVARLAAPVTAGVQPAR